jgi:hypothetical protein
VSDWLRESGYPRQAKRKRAEGASPPGRHEQFAPSSPQAQGFRAPRHPVIAGDAQQQESLGNCQKAGTEDPRSGKAPQGRVYDLLEPGRGQALPYGVDDLARERGWGSAGSSHATAEFAVATRHAGWRQRGQPLDQQATARSIPAEGGGRTGSRVRLGQTDLQRLAHALPLTLQGWHFPPGTSKGKKSEQRLFSFIPTNGRGRPLLDRVTVVNLSGTTQTETGLALTARLDPKRSAKGRRVSAQELRRVHLRRDPFPGEWNYSILPQTPRNTEVINAC